jgi:ABC-type transport system involved in cytochrome bd biosynthesis fused ATPase/permease subunit
MDQAIKLVLGHFSPQVAAILSYLAILIPIVAIVVKLTPTKKDDEVLEKVKELYGKVKDLAEGKQEATTPSASSSSDEVRSY